MQTTLKQLISDHPILKEIQAYQPVYWQNPDFGQAAKLPWSAADIFDAAARWERFAPYLATAFPETAGSNGIIESPLLKLDGMQKAFNQYHHTTMPGQLYLKADNLLPISGSIKSRGGIYEVLKFAEKIAMREGDLAYLDNYAVLATEPYHRIFENYGIAVGSTGNLGLSIGIVAATFGFQTTVHMSADARQWKKDLLRSKGVEVVEYPSDFTTAITAGREKAAHEPQTYFIDDEGSQDLLLGYAVAGIRLQKQLKTAGIEPSVDEPVFVYLPAGVGGSPSGVSFGLQTIMPQGIYPVFVEPTHVPSVTVGMLTGLNDQIAVRDLGLDGRTAADGLAVGRPSRIAGELMRTLLYGAQTFDDDEIYRYLALLSDTEDISVEPSAAAGFTGILPTIEHFQDSEKLAHATHIVWATGGKMVPAAEFQTDYQHGKQLLAN